MRVQLAAGRRHLLNEIDRRGSSCPVVFAWNGERYEFIADMIGPGIVGHWVAPGERNIPDPTEYLKIDGRRVKPRNGRLSFRFAEVMEELTYLDHVRLIAVDHPADVTVVNPNEYFASAPPFPAFKVIASRNARPPVAARDDGGRDVLPMLLHHDRRYVTGFEPIQFGGFAKLHYLELDLGTAYAGGPLRLLMQGFIEYFTATSVFAAHQAGIQAIVPFLDVQAPGRAMGARDRRHRFSGRTGPNLGCRPHRQGAGRHVTHSHRHESEDLLGPDPDRHDAPDRVPSNCTRCR